MNQEKKIEEIKPCQSFHNKNGNKSCVVCARWNGFKAGQESKDKEWKEMYLRHLKDKGEQARQEAFDKATEIIENTEIFVPGQMTFTKLEVIKITELFVQKLKSERDGE